MPIVITEPIIAFVVFLYTISAFIGICEILFNAEFVAQLLSFVF